MGTGINRGHHPDRPPRRRAPRLTLTLTLTFTHPAGSGVTEALTDSWDLAVFWRPV